MSSQSIITDQNLPTGDIIGQLISKVSIDLLKELRFEVGHVCTLKMKNILRLSRLHCNDFCYIDSEQQDKIRELLIEKAILKIDGL